MDGTEDSSHRDNRMTSSGMTMMRGGMFFTADDTGQMKPVHECLTIECGKDFEKVARWNTVFNYNQYNGGSERHEIFWKGREFEVLLLTQCKKNKLNCWIKGKVVSWYEYNMGPGDRCCKWTLTANIITPNPLGVGSVVYHPENREDNKLAIIIKVEEDGKKCTIRYEEDGLCSPGWGMEELRLYDGQLEFEVHRMNAQGGGILKCLRLGKALNNVRGLSMKWLTPVSESDEDMNPNAQSSHEGGEEGIRIPGIAHGLRMTSERVEDGDWGGCWFFDPKHQGLIDPSSLVMDEMAVNFRAANVKMIMDGDKVLESQKFHAQLQKLLISQMEDDETFCHALLSTPFHIYEDMVDYFLLLFHGEVKLDDDTAKLLQEMDLAPDGWTYTFHTIIATGMYLRQDEEWRRSLGGHIVMSDEDLNVSFEASLYRIVNKIGEWFEEQNESRAAIWCYNHNLKSVRDPNVRFPPTARRRFLVSQLCYIGLANKRMDNFFEACRYYEEAIIECSSVHSSAFGRPGVKEDLIKNLTGNAKQMQSEAKEWFGTASAMTSWGSTDNIIVANKCSTCGADGATKKCSACHSVRYCNADCQQGHWIKAHKRTCLGKLRRK